MNGRWWLAYGHREAFLVVQPCLFSFCECLHLHSEAS
jgi:hypothetical protein